MRERRERRDVPEGWFLGDFHEGEDGRANWRSVLASRGALSTE